MSGRLLGLVRRRSSRRSSSTSGATAATLVIALMIPLFQLILFGFIDQTVSNLPTVVVDQDGTRYARELMDKLRATHTFAHQARDARPARRARRHRRRHARASAS